MSPLHKNSGECSYFDGKGWLHLTTTDTLVSADIARCKLNIQNLQKAYLERREGTHPLC